MIPYRERQKVLDYIRENPGCMARDISLEFGYGLREVSGILVRLHKRNIIETVKTASKRTNEPNKWRVSRDRNNL